MSKGSFKVIAEFFGTSLIVYAKGHDRRVMANEINIVDVDPTYFSDMEFKSADKLHEFLIKSGHLNCNSVHTKDDRSVNVCLDKLGLYVLTTKKNGGFVVDPCEKEHMERFLAGTDDPLYDLVHELRYNPNIRLGEEVREAENHFKKKLKK